MTLILSCMTSTHAIQVSDRRLTFPNGQIHDSEANKAVLFCDHIAFGYTGQAYMDAAQKDRTDLWLVRVLSESSFPTLSAALRTIELRAAESLRRIPGPTERKHLGFVGIGWGQASSNGPLQPLICQVSNFQDKYGNWQEKASDTFSSRIHLLRHVRSNPFNLVAAGMRMDRLDMRRLKRSLKGHVLNKGDPQGIAELLVKEIRRVAVSKPQVGQSLMVISLPREAIGRPSFWLPSGAPAYATLSSAPTMTERTFLYIPTDTTRGVEYGPHFVCGGGAMTNWKVIACGDRTEASVGITLPPNEVSQAEDTRLRSAFKKGEGARAIFETAMILQPGVPPRSPRRYPDLPPSFMDTSGNWQGGYSMVEELPRDTCRVMVHTHSDTIAAMKRNPRYTWVEDIADKDPRYFLDLAHAE